MSRWPSSRVLGLDQGLWFIKVRDFKRGSISSYIASTHWYIVGNESWETRYQSCFIININAAQVRASVGTQPRISKFPTLLPEFKEVCTVAWLKHPSTNNKMQLAAVFLWHSRWVKTVAFRFDKGGRRRTATTTKVCFWYLQITDVSCWRRIETTTSVRQLRGCVRWLFEIYSKHQSSTTLLAWKKKALELKAEDKSLFGEMTSGRRSVLKGKKSASWDHCHWDWLAWCCPFWRDCRWLQAHWSSGQVGSDWRRL